MTLTLPPVTLGETWRRLRADVEQLLPHMGATRGVIGKLSLFSTPAVTSVALHRLAHWLLGRGMPGAAGLLAGINYVVNKIAISPGARIGPGLFIPHPAGVVFRGHAGERLTLYHRAMVSARSVHVDKVFVSGDCPQLGDGVTVGVFSVVAGPITLGSGSFVGAYAVVTESTPDDSILLDRHSIRVEREPTAEADQPTAR